MLRDFSNRAEADQQFLLKKGRSVKLINDFGVHEVTLNDSEGSRINVVLLIDGFFRERDV